MSTIKHKKNKKAFLKFKTPWKYDNKRDKVGFSRTSIHLPPIVEQACTFLEQYGTPTLLRIHLFLYNFNQFNTNKPALQQEGLFRISGSQEDVRILKDKFDKGYSNSFTSKVFFLKSKIKKKAEKLYSQKTPAQIQ